MLFTNLQYFEKFLKLQSICVRKHEYRNLGTYQMFTLNEQIFVLK